MDHDQSQGNHSFFPLDENQKRDWKGEGNYLYKDDICVKSERYFYITP